MSPQIGRWRTILTFSLVALAIWIPRVLQLDQFVTVDERLWLTRSANFYCALSQGDWPHTFQSEHPGVTTMYAGMMGFLWRAPGYVEDCTTTLDAKDHEAVFDARGLDPLVLLAGGRFFVVLMVTAALVVAFRYGRGLVGEIPAVVGFLFIAFEPFYLAHSRLLHLDGLLSTFMFLSLLAFLSYLRQRQPRDLWVSGIAAGLSWLTKSPGFFLVPFMGLLVVGDGIRILWMRRHNSFDPDTGTTGVNHGNALRFCLAVFKPFLLWLVVGVAVFVFLWPAMWQSPRYALSQIFYKAAHDSSVGHRSPIFFDGKIVEDGALGAEFYYFYLLTYLWRSTPGSVLGLFLAVLLIVWRYIPGTKKRRVLSSKADHYEATGLWLVIFGLLFAFGISLGTKKFDRYLLPVYPALDLSAGIGWGMVLYRVWRGTSMRFTRGSLAGLLMALQLGAAVRTFPYYLSYYNPLMGGARRAPQVMMIGWGEGLDQAARYFNAKRDVESLRVASWCNPASFSYFFDGASEEIPTGVEFAVDPHIRDNFFESDYVVIYAHQWQINRPSQLLDYLTYQTPEHSIWLNGIEYARLYYLNENFYAASTYRPVGASVGSVVRFEGYDLPHRKVIPGDLLPFDLVWRALEPPGERLKVFAHLLDSQGQLVAQHDDEPLNGFAPTDNWRPGQRVADDYGLLLPVDLQPGLYTLKVGMYRLSGERLSIEYEGHVIPDSAFPLGIIEVLSP